MNKQQLILIALFIGLSILASTIKFTPVLVGEKLNFTFFDLYAPMAGGFFGALFGTAAVLLSGIGSLLAHQTFSLAAVLHLFPVMFGAWYFGTDKKLVNLIPLAAILGFIIHPIGRQVWYYSLFWLIPILASFYKKKSVLARSLGATFTTHAVGGLLWIYAFNPPAAVWIGLIPVVVMERSVFTAASAIMYLVLKKAYEIYTNQNRAVSAAKR